MKSSMRLASDNLNNTWKVIELKIVQSINKEQICRPNQ